MTNQAKTPKYSPEVRERAVRMVAEHRGGYPSEWAAMSSIAAKFDMSTTTPARHWAALPVFVLAVAIAAAFGAQFMPGEWYAALKKPSWNPPNWIFAPVWTALYVMIAVASWLAWRAGAETALAFWGAGLVLNALWSFLFFGQKLIGGALTDIVLLLATIIGFIATAWRLNRTAALLFMPYLAWVSLATAMNTAIFLLNR